MFLAISQKWAHLLPFLQFVTQSELAVGEKALSHNPFCKVYTKWRNFMQCTFKSDYIILTISVKATCLVVR